MIWSNLIIVKRKFEKLTFSTKSYSESTKSIRVRTVKTKGYSKSGFPLINSSGRRELGSAAGTCSAGEDYEILYGSKPYWVCKAFFRPFSTGTGSGPLKGEELSPEWVSGFIDGEGSFTLKFIKRSGYSLGWGVEPAFTIGLHAKDLLLLEKIQAFFGVGKIAIGNNNVVFYYVSSVQELTDVIIPHFERFPLITKKKADYLLFKSALDIINSKGPKKPLTLEYLSKLVSIKGALNWGLPDVLKEAFSDIAPALRPEIKLPTEITPQWLSGFIDAEGCFYILISKSKLYKTGASVQLQFSITQHSRDAELVYMLKDFLKCGFIKTGKKQPVVVLTVTKFTDIQNIIIPLFKDKNTLQGAKLHDYLAFLEVAKIMEDKTHLTSIGLERIIKIKEGMNSNRKF